MSETKRKFRSLEEIREYIYGMKEECYWSLSALENLLERDVPYILFSEAIDLYKEYGYPEVFEYVADVIEWAAKRAMEKDPYALMHDGLGLAYILKLLAKELRQDPSGLNLEEVNKKIEELLDLSNRVCRFDRSLKEYFIEDPEAGYVLLRRMWEILSLLADAVAQSFALILRTNNPETLPRMYKIIKRETKISANFEHWLEHIMNNDIKVRLRYIHKRIYDLIHKILILRGGMAEFFFFLKKKGFLHRTFSWPSSYK